MHLSSSHIILLSIYAFLILVYKAFNTNYLSVLEGKFKSVSSLNGYYILDYQLIMDMKYNRN